MRMDRGTRWSTTGRQTAESGHRAVATVVFGKITKNDLALKAAEASSEAADRD